MAILEPRAPATRPFGYDAGPISAALIAEPGARADAARAMLEAAGAVTRTLGFVDASRDVSDQGRIDLILIDAAEADEALLDAALARADTLADERMLPVVAMLAIEQVDIAVAHLLGPRTQLLCNPSDAEIAAAIALACLQAGERTGVRGSDVNPESEAVRLQRLNEEVARIAEALARLTRGEELARSESVRDSGTGYRGPDDGDPPAVNAQEVRNVIRARRMRSHFFDSALFADPAWDMLLDLFAAELENRRVSVSSLCIAAAVPPTTALRWITTLHAAGLFERQADPADRRRAYIALSPKGAEGMRSFASAVKRQGLGLI
ncbi:winged helix DNA-binding protein [Sphingomonas sp.]|uniref:winged helix DNA-binding protein n=1 Tax=Sphingomonas sp. TaxID=28214 RepID=UPI001AFDE876|nr:winged helix DNA-binding protein [Sphingomonas sp.]MBO9715047.1 winged helix DNA-binding protein [Sphingomonas sp.]